MDTSKFTEKSQQAFVAAQSLATGQQHAEVAPEHLLVALLEQTGGIVPSVARTLKADPAALAREARQRLDALPQARGGEIRLSSRVPLLVEAAQAEAGRLQDEYVSTEHLLLAIAAEKGRSPAAEVLKAAGITREALDRALKAVRGSQRVTSPNPESTYEALTRYGRDLTELAQAGKLDPVIGRDEEVRRVIQVLSRRTKNNPVLIGEPGVGKTAIVEGIAQQIGRASCRERVC